MATDNLKLLLLTPFDFIRKSDILSVNYAYKIT